MYPPIFLCLEMMIMVMVMVIVMAMAMVCVDKLEVTFCDHKILVKRT